MSFMKRAIELSRIKMQNLEGGPFGAVIVKDGVIIAEGWNQVTSTKDPTAHAEISAIRKACEKLDDFQLSGCEIYTSCEPCPMCLAAIYWARLDKIIYANTKEDAAAIEFDDNFLYEEISKPLNLRTILTEQTDRDQANKVFREWSDMSNKIKY